MLPHSNMTSKKTRFLPAIQLLFLSLSAVSILRAPADACAFAALALKLWFEKMIPSLFPFMVLSGLIVRLELSRSISLPIFPVLGRLYRISRTMCTTLLLGFLFGFPLGAKTIAEQYSLRQLTKPQAQYLLSFCNNIGPVYLLSFALPLLGLSGGAENLPLRTAVILFFFGIPLLYGLILRHTFYHCFSFSSENPPACAVAKPDSESTHPGPGSSARLKAASAEYSRPSFISSLDASITSACGAIARLGGYMVFFIVCNLPLGQISHLLKSILPQTSQYSLAVFTAPVLEITSGLSLAEGILAPALFMTMLTFGGLSCFAQTYTCIRETDLSFGNYCFHKLAQTLIAFCLYTLLFSAFS